MIKFSDETCVLCHYCFTHSNHEGHDVAFYHAQAGGCCDCGDEDAWNKDGFCDLHGKRNIVNKDLFKNNDGGRNGGILEKDVDLKVRGVLKSCVEYIRLLACSVEIGYERANGGKILMMDNNDSTISSTSSSVCRDVVMIGDDECNNENEKYKNNTDEKQKSPYVRRRSSLSGFKRKSDSEDKYASDSNDNEKIGMDYDMTLVRNNISFSSSNEQMTSPASPMDVDVSSPAQSLPTSTNTNEEFKFDPTAASTSKSRNSTSTQPFSGSRENEHPFQKQKFNPKYASMSKSRSQKNSSSLNHMKQQRPISPNLSRAHQLGLLGSQQDGLYLILHADDVHQEGRIISNAIKELFQSCSFSNSSTSLPNQNDIFSPSSINIEAVTRYIPALFNKKDSPMGDLIVWGPFELMEELGPVLSQCWKDGDATACSRFGSLMLDKAAILQEKGLVVSIKTRVELCREVRALAVLEFLKMMSDCCDPLCHLVSLALGGYLDDNACTRSSLESDGSECLSKMLKNDLKLPRMISRQWHDLLLKLLSEPNFKAALSNSYIDTYTDVTREYAHGVGILDKSSYTLSVQFLNRVTYVQDLVRKKDLLGCLMRSLLHTLSEAKTSTDGNARDTQTIENDRLGMEHEVIFYRRYTPCISDLKCVLNVPGIARLFASIPRFVSRANVKPNLDVKHCVDAWIETLTLAQNMDIHSWRSEMEGHVETESRNWISAFNASISLGSLFERLLMWKNSDDVPDNFESYPFTLLNTIELTQYVLLRGVALWQKTEGNYMNSSQKNGGTKSIEPMILPMSTISTAHGCTDELHALTFTQKTRWSFHLPLHRFLAACLREVVRRPSPITNEGNSISRLLTNLQASSVDISQIVDLFNGLIEFPLMVLSRAAQIRSKLWKRNGSIMMDQVVNYSEPSFCKSLRDADLMLMQFGMIGNIILSQEKVLDPNPDVTSQVLDCARFICLLLHRFGIFKFVGFEIHRDDDGQFCSNEEQMLDYEQDTPATNDPDRLSSMLEEFLLLLIIFITELPAPQCTNESKHIELAKQRLRREVVHRLASGSKTHSDLSEVHHVLPLHDHVSLIFGCCFD